tara:strand:+ start:59 stop:214 length:156 start_codon:yes stop_codon:yes gene_type:complete
MILKKGIQVKVITGKDKVKTNEIMEIERKLNKIKVDKYKGWVKQNALWGRL